MSPSESRRASPAGERRRSAETMTGALARARPSLGQVSCELEGNRVVLRGVVPTFYVKQLAQTLLMVEADGPLELDNRLEVLPVDDRRWFERIQT